jgi:hypothetical protein
MTVKDIYAETIIQKFPSYQLLIEYLVFEKKVLKMEDNEEKLTYYLQEKFHKKLNEYLSEYEVKRNGPR